MSDSHERLPLRSFRDPAGSILLQPDAVLREVHPAYAAQTLRFLEHPLAARLVAEGRLIPTQILSSPATPGEPLRLCHPRVAFISYPWEWPPSLWRSAAELTLHLAIDLLSHDLTLKDATPLNVLFQGPRPIFVDLLSIDAADPSTPLWLPYSQFVRTFLLPLLAHTELGWPLYATLLRRDGYEPEEIYALLPWTKRLRQPALSTVTLPALLGSRSKSMELSRGYERDPELTRHIQRKAFHTLLLRVRQVAHAPRASSWTDYPATSTHYTQAARDEKHAFVAAALNASVPKHVLAIGCNTGTYPRLAAQAGASVVAIDSDSGAVDTLAASLIASPLDILPLCVDIARPSPSVGWLNREQLSFLDRCRGSFDTVFLLAVLHHLLLSSQIPLDHIASLCADLTTRHLLIEWVPPADPMFQQLLRGRDSLYEHLTEEAFRRAFSFHFCVIAEKVLPNGRILLHMVKETG